MHSCDYESIHSYVTVYTRMLLYTLVFYCIHSYITVYTRMLLYTLVCYCIHSYVTTYTRILPYTLVCYRIIIIIIKKDWQCQAGRGRMTPYQSEDPNPTLPTYSGKEEKGKIV